MAAVERKVIPLDDAPRRTLGRPPGSTGSQIERNKHRLASLVVLGKRNGQIAREFGVSCRTIRAWLDHPEVQEAIREAEEEVVRRTKGLVFRVYCKSIRAIERILTDGDTKSKLRAIELIWITQGRLPPRGARVTLCNHNHLETGTPRCQQSGQRALDQEEAREAMSLLRAERERQERAEADRVKQRDRPVTARA
jgi:hypothetical protein